MGELPLNRSRRRTRGIEKGDLKMSEEICQTEETPKIDEAEKERLAKLEAVHNLITKSREANDKLYEAYQDLTYSRLLFAETGDFKIEKKLEWLGKRILSIYRANIGIEFSLPDDKTIVIDLVRMPKKSTEPKMKGKPKK